MQWNLYLVKHPAGEFIGVAVSDEEARQHFGNVAEITCLETREAVTTVVLGLRANSKSVFGERVLLAL